MPPPEDGNQDLSFVDLIRLEKINEDTYRSIALPFSPGGHLKGATGRAYGGHVFAQAAWAACRTVGKGFLLHNVSGNFILGGLKHIPFVYTVSRTRDGRSYATRIVQVTQQEGQGICFTCTCSFQTAESSPVDVQDDADADLWTRYAASLRGQRPDDFEDCPGMDVPWYWAMRRETGFNDAFPGLQSTKADMSAYNDARHALDRRGLMFYRPRDPLPLEDRNLHLCGHLLFSDRNSLYVVVNHMDAGDLYTQMGTLVHQVVFHGPVEDLLFRPSRDGARSPMDDAGPAGRWFAKEDWTTRAAAGRVLLSGRLWSADGRHVATLMQDGMVRFSKKPLASREEVAKLREREAGWKTKPREKL